MHEAGELLAAWPMPFEGAAVLAPTPARRRRAAATPAAAAAESSNDEARFDAHCHLEVVPPGFDTVAALPSPSCPSDEVRMAE